MSFITTGYMSKTEFLQQYALSAAMGGHSADIRYAISVWEEIEKIRIEGYSKPAPTLDPEDILVKRQP